MVKRVYGFISIILIIKQHVASFFCNKTKYHRSRTTMSSLCERRDLGKAAKTQSPPFSAIESLPETGRPFILNPMQT